MVPSAGPSGREPETSTDPLAAVAAVVAGTGVSGRRLREVIAELADGWRSLEELVRSHAVPRRTVEALLRAAGTDLDGGPRGSRLRPDRVPAYAEAFGTARLAATRPADPVGWRLAGHADLVTRIARDVAAAPEARAALDHVSATAETVVRRALLLDGMFDLAGRRVLCVGDHDLTSLALRAVVPDVEVAVVDLDERILEYLDRTSTARGLGIGCRWADLRFGLPDEVTGWADAVLTDPPYTPEGVQLFLGRGLQGLRDRSAGRVVLAYGYSDLAPALGTKVQRAALDLELAFEAILPAFNRYHGAQAVGSASDLYVCQPTARTWAVLDRRLEKAAVAIYTHGAQSLEGRSPSVELGPVRSAALDGLAADTPVITVNGSGDDGRTVPWERLLSAGLPAAWTRQRPVVAVVDLSADPGPWLLRCLLTANADRLAVVVPNDHPDVSDDTGRRALAELVATKYSLRVHRATPAGRSAVVHATAVEPDGLDAGARLVRRLLDRAHGKVANVWRDGLVALSRRGDATVTKNDARTLVSVAATRPDVLDARVLDLPRHLMREVCADVADSGRRAARAGAGSAQ